LMNRSGLNGNMASAVFTLGALIVVSPFAISEFGGAATNVVWTMAIGACIFGGLGLLLFNGMLSRTPPEAVGSLFILMIVVQIVVPAMYQVFQSGELGISKIIGFSAAMLAAFMLA